MKQIAVIADGAGPHERGVYVVGAKDETDALNKVADYLIQADQEYGGAAVSKGEVENHHSPTYEQSVLNDEGSEVYGLSTADVLILN